MLSNGIDPSTALSAASDHLVVVEVTNTILAVSSAYYRRIAAALGMTRLQKWYGFWPVAQISNLIEITQRFSLVSTFPT